MISGAPAIVRFHHRRPTAGPQRQDAATGALLARTVSATAWRSAHSSQGRHAQRGTRAQRMVPDEASRGGRGGVCGSPAWMDKPRSNPAPAAPVHPSPSEWRIGRASRMGTLFASSSRPPTVPSQRTRRDALSADLLPLFRLPPRSWEARVIWHAAETRDPGYNYWARFGEPAGRIAAGGKDVRSYSQGVFGEGSSRRLLPDRPPHMALCPSSPTTTATPAAVPPA